ncbi:MAG: PTS sugar transporter subunit IIB [Firmicutes bacterium]|nr:PTS sugar transporter subunit IIB [Bacillota bacterium]
MSELALVRVDGRVIHGAICMVWGTAVSATKIIAVDNVVAKNPVLKRITEAVAKNVPAKVVTVDEIVEMWKKDQFGDGRALVVFKTIAYALEAKNAGFDYDQLQIGLTLMDKDTQRLDKTLFISKKDVEMLEELEQKNVTIYTQYSPPLPAEPWKTSIKDKFKE